MKQLDLFEDGPQPIQRWLHVWSEAERERRIKNPHASGREAQRVEVMQLPHKRQDATHDE